jgi:hypothetical protein
MKTMQRQFDKHCKQVHKPEDASPTAAVGKEAIKD